MFNEDIEAKEIPASVQRVKEQIAKSQGLLFGVT